MAHEINSIAWAEAGGRPWHGLGMQLPANSSIEEWARCAGMEWTIETAPVEFTAGSGPQAPRVTYDRNRVLYRSDNQYPLSIVSDSYKIVQPAEVLGIFREMVKTQGYDLESAGCLRGGKRFWALARMKELAELPGDDKVAAYLLVATSADGSLSTVVIPTSIRVVCANTLHATMRDAEGGLRIPHSATFDAKAVRSKLQKAREHWLDYSHLMTMMSRKHISTDEAIRFFEVALGSFAANQGEQAMEKHTRSVRKVLDLYNGAGKGALLPSSTGTVWGAMNAITEFIDHGRHTRSEDSRLSSVWFGTGARVKQRALDQAVFLV